MQCVNRSDVDSRNVSQHVQLM